MTDRTHYVQINDRSLIWTHSCSFWVHQGYNLGPVRLNLYGKDLTEVLPAELRFHQYAKDTMIYGHCKLFELQSCPADMQLVLDIKLFIWLSQCNLALNPKKTKVMLLATVRFSKTHRLDERWINLSSKGKGPAEVLNFWLTSYESARKPQLDKRDRLHHFKLLQNIACTEKVKYVAPYNTLILTIIFPFRGVFFFRPMFWLCWLVCFPVFFSFFKIAFHYFLFIYCFLANFINAHSVSVTCPSSMPIFTPSFVLYTFD